MEEQRERQEEEVEYQVNQIVWAKIMGFPWWPAKITQLPNNHNHLFRVDFFSDNTHAFLAPSKINKYSALRPQKDMHRPLRKGLHKAIAAAEEALASLPSVPTPVPAAAEPVEADPTQQKQLLQSPSNLTQLQENKLPTVVQQSESHSEQQSHSQSPTPTHSHPHTPHRYPKEQRERFVKNLLKKYRLTNIPKTPDQQPNSKLPLKNINHRRTHTHKRRTPQSKHKRTSKLPHQRHTLSYLLTRKIYTLLNHKQELPAIQRKEISSSLARELLCGGGGAEEVNRLFKWLSISHSNTIAHFYQNWGSLQASEKEKASNMTTQE